MRKELPSSRENLPSYVRNENYSTGGVSCTDDLEICLPAVLHSVTRDYIFHEIRKQSLSLVE
jgi:hypothetical protein